MDDELWYVFFDRRRTYLYGRQTASREHIAALQAQTEQCRQRSVQCEQYALELLEAVAQTQQRATGHR